ncbi:O-antigen ligase-like membrane protein [Gelidibacter sediminis]|uniref:O-antigen ligase-like membrane protein n=1 Tax=Gelidibacter sediminis TaxID=1608710 RepID=A0A4R7Q0Q4_9FLAO|nr:O-antigen ligase family protein [Gelidibacter sediminis]TDU40010.1 O-antigen ligase-like membrane protein [Gelidibacter sediminis]
MKILKYLILIMLLWGIPSFFSYDVSIGSKLSFLTYGLLLLYYFLSAKNKLILPFLILGLLYFAISALSYVDNSLNYITELIKYIILILAGGEIVRKTTINEFFVMLMLGACSILIHAMLFQDGFGRYSGLYLNPNGAGFICIIGYCLSFDITKRNLQILGQFIFTLAGITTFSRTFIILWLLVSTISILANRKNTLNFVFGLGAIVIAYSLATFMQLNTTRFNAFENLLNSDTNSTAQAIIQEDSRMDTWSQYYSMILDRPLLGNGYQVMSGLDSRKQGVHNTFLMVLGESGIIPFLLIVTIYLYLLLSSIKYLHIASHKLMLSIVLIAILMTMHNYFDNYVIIFTSMWLFASITNNVNSGIQPLSSI